MDQHRTWRATGAALVAGLCVLAVSGIAIANGAVVTRGDFSTLAAAVGQPEEGLVGRAQTVRSSDGSTHIEVGVRGLQPGVTYGIHLHNAPCSAANPGGGHYQHEADAGAAPPNELWPSSSPHDAMAGITANAAGVASGRGTADWIAGESAVSVVLHAGVGHGATSTAGGPKLACADLG